MVGAVLVDFGCQGPLREDFSERTSDTNVQANTSGQRSRSHTHCQSDLLVTQFGDTGVGDPMDRCGRVQAPTGTEGL